MGMIQCKTHGFCGIAINIEKNICNKINDNKEILLLDLLVVKVYLYDDNDQYLCNENYIFTHKTISKHNIKLVYEIHNEEDEEQLNVLNNLVGVICAKCFSEYKFIDNIQKIIDEYRNRDSPLFG